MSFPDGLDIRRAGDERAHSPIPSDKVFKSGDGEDGGDKAVDPEDDSAESRHYDQGFPI